MNIQKKINKQIEDLLHYGWIKESNVKLVFSEASIFMLSNGDMLLSIGTALLSTADSSPWVIELKDEGIHIQTGEITPVLFSYKMYSQVLSFIYAGNVSFTLREGYKEGSLEQNDIAIANLVTRGKTLMLKMQISDWLKKESESRNGEQK